MIDTINNFASNILQYKDFIIGALITLIPFCIGFLGIFIVWAAKWIKNNNLNYLISKGEKIGYNLAGSSYKLLSKFIKNKEDINEPLDLLSSFGDAIDSGWDAKVNEIKSSKN